MKEVLKVIPETIKIKCNVNTSLKKSYKITRILLPRNKNRHQMAEITYQQPKTRRKNMSNNRPSWHTQNTKLNN